MSMHVYVAVSSDGVLLLRTCRLTNNEFAAILNAIIVTLVLVAVASYLVIIIITILLIMLP